MTTEEKPIRYGATPAEWDHFLEVLGLVNDLWPVVSNPNAVISPNSKMKQLGKTPSRYNVTGQVAGVSEWTSKPAKLVDIQKWREISDYGICIVTRKVRGIDVDVTDIQQAIEIHQLIKDHFGVLPARIRENSSKFLCAIMMPGSHPKRVIKTKHGIVEFLGTGQQFVAAGTHPSGVRYEWNGGLPQEIPVVTIQQFDAFWSDLENRYAIEPSQIAKAPSKHAQLNQAASKDEVAVRLLQRKHVISQDTKTGQLNIICPFDDEHSEETAESSTVYWPANTGGFAQGHFKCLHGHCTERTDQEYLDKLGFGIENDFDVLPPEIMPTPPKRGLPPEVQVVSVPSEPAYKAPVGFEEHPDYDASLFAPLPSDLRFAFSPAYSYATAAPLQYIIKGVLPAAELVVLYGASTSGKTFAVLDMACSIARDEDWRNMRVRGGRVAYVVAEGANFFRGRLKAYAMHHDIPLEDIDLHILGNAPNLLSRTDTADLIDALRQLGPLRLVVIDTLAQTMAGGDENSGQDVGKLLSHCKHIHRHTGATILLVHHSGKDETRGARGWSGLRAACDAELEVTRNEQYRSIRISKQKDGQDGVEYGFRLKPVVIGMDDDGDAIESCVVDHDHVPAASQPPRYGRRVRGNVEKLMYAQALDLIGPGGAGLSAGDLISATVEHMVYDEQNGKRDQRRRYAQRGLDSLVDAKYLVVHNGKIFLACVDEPEPLC